MPGASLHYTAPPHQATGQALQQARDAVLGMTERWHVSVSHGTRRGKAAALPVAPLGARGGKEGGTYHRRRKTRGAVVSPSSAQAFALLRLAEQYACLKDFVDDFWAQYIEVSESIQCRMAVGKKKAGETSTFFIPHAKTMTKITTQQPTHTHIHTHTHHTPTDQTRTKGHGAGLGRVRPFHLRHALLHRSPGRGASQGRKCPARAGGAREDQRACAVGWASQMKKN